MKRRKETFNFAQKVHGGGPESQLPGSVGIIDTTLNKSSSGALVDMLSTNKKFNSSVLPAIYKKKLLEYESSHENMIRSVSVYYSGGVAGKKKYRKIYKDPSFLKKALRARNAGVPLSTIALFLVLSHIIS